MNNAPEPQGITFSNLMNDIERGFVKIPQFQRNFVWTKEKSAKLLDSIIKGYPVGTFILWKTKESLRVVRNLGNAVLPDTPSGDFVQYVLDGQQRLASLYSAYRGLSIKREERIDNFSEMYVDLLASGDEDVDIVITNKDGKDEKSIIRIVDLLNADLTFLTKFPQQFHKKLSEYKDRFQSYRFSAIFVQEASLDVATEIFTRINVNGRPLSVFEIMVAKTFDSERDFDLAEEYNILLEQLRNVDYDTISSSVVLQAVSIILIKECSKKHILKLNKVSFVDVWSQTVDAIERAVEYLRNSYRIPVSQLLPYGALLIPFTYFFYHHPDRPAGDMKNYLEDFFWRTSLSGRYSYGVEGKLAQDVKRINQILKGKRPSYDYPVDISPDFIKENGWFSSGRSYIKAILCLLAYHQPKSFIDHSVVRISNDWLKRANSKNYHHFFPRAYLKKMDQDDFSANHIANITIVDDFLNKRKIGDKPPSEYMTYFKKENSVLKRTMKTHLIDVDNFGIWENDYELFFEMRCQSISAELAKRIIPRKIDRMGQEINLDDREYGEIVESDEIED
jgi:hypothetical protein